jgi:hypothetical protein
VVLSLDSALIAMCHAAGKPLFFKVLKAAIVIRELRIEVIYRVPQVLRDCLSPVHRNIMPYVLLDVKG